MRHFAEALRIIELPSASLMESSDRRIHPLDFNLFMEANRPYVVDCRALLM